MYEIYMPYIDYYDENPHVAYVATEEEAQTICKFNNQRFNEKESPERFYKYREIPVSNLETVFAEIKNEIAKEIKAEEEWIDIADLTDNQKEESLKRIEYLKSL